MSHTTHDPIINGVNGTEERKLEVIIVGGGIGGLVAAISLRRQGHNVEVYEQSRLANEIGAAIHMVPNAVGVLKPLGIDVADSGAIPCAQTVLFTANNEVMQKIDNTRDAHRWQNPWMMAHRAHLHTQLKNAATSPDQPGRPVKLNTSSKVISVDPEIATVHLADGSSHSGDVVIGADGVHSNARKALMNDAPAPVKGAHNCFRFILERQVAVDDPETRLLVEEMNSMNMWYLADMKIVMYSTSNNKLLNFVCIHPEHLTSVSDDYTKSASKPQMLEIFKDFHSSIVKLMGKVDPADLKIYPLYHMEVLPTFVSGRMALIGDAAHPFTPHLAQGGAMAIEDGAALGVMLGNGVLPNDVPERLQLYNKARYERATNIQQFSVEVGRDSVSSKPVNDYIEYGFSHDEIHASTELLRQHQWRQQGSAQCWRQPLSFGLLPGPRQDAFGRSHRQALRNSTTTKASIKFKTSSTILRNLFPNERYSFEKRDTVAVASFSLQSLENMAWLGGGGYDLLALYIHDVCYRQNNGQIVKGTFCPVMFENLADPIVTGREELGVPKVFSDIEISRSSTSCHATLSWRGTQWAEFHWKTLKYDTATVDEAEDPIGGLLVHKYIPATGQKSPQEADANYAVFIPAEPGVSTIKSKSVARKSDLEVRITDLGWQKLPTLHPIVSRLAEIPIFEFLDGAVTAYQGVSDLAGAQRLD
ncbi:uncharacterized protein A1O9_03369 [Exophiala aquamarina CBS 119918]|uniref:FAD-binding domain-containing protein n=1 Tax=Exophiala aquamarina CBS 119918 TaxID=1182545 RepID=A0A072PP10_9EURO|nr:uncharacterized protein A1O9_03369 [Exophiala aquamarina CBS 119918]KEF61799.1 hypothetical protein A1O9_03369 [Exophiala aquamarina CBS 119918]